MSEPCLLKQQQIKTFFSSCSSQEKIYHGIISLGKELPLTPVEFRTPDNIVAGCQSIVYLHATFLQEKIYFTAYSEALISSGLAALLIKVYSGQPPLDLIQCPPLFLEELGIPASLSPGRSNGLASMFRRMQQEALKFLISI